MMKTVKLSVYGIEVTFDRRSLGSGCCTSSCKDICPTCGEPDCNQLLDISCLGLAPGGENEGMPSESLVEAVCRLQHNSAIEGIESLTLACACAGINVESPAFGEALKTAIDAVGNTYLPEAREY